MSEAPLGPAEDERIVWGAMRVPPEPIPAGYSIANRIFHGVVLFVTLSSLWIGWRDDPGRYIDTFKWVIPFWIGVFVLGQLAVKNKDRLISLKARYIDRHVRPRANALWLSDTRLVVEPRGRLDTDFAVPLSDFSSPRLDYDEGARVVVVDWPGGPIILRTHDADGLLGALRSRIGGAAR